ncbi:MAG: DUF4412 domain-containing protein [Ignavibacteriales bacterium]|nr:DUF4412 domain-containing protein [Ignavibacteriales bacterium]
MTSRILRIVILTSGLILGTHALGLAQEVLEKKSFEGVVSYQIRDVQSIETMTVFMKRGRLRLEGSEQAGGNAVLTDYALKKSYVIISGREQYIELPVIAMPAKQPASPPRINVQKTDSTDTIEDYECDQFLVTVDTLEFEIWATKGLGTAGSFLLERVSAWMWKILEMGYFPMRFIARDATGEESGRFDVTSVTKKSLTESLFRIPSGYERIDPEALQTKQVPKKRKR